MKRTYEVADRTDWSAPAGYPTVYVSSKLPASAHRIGSTVGMGVSFEASPDLG